MTDASAASLPAAIADLDRRRLRNLLMCGVAAAPFVTVAGYVAGAILHPFGVAPGFLAGWTLALSGGAGLFLWAVRGHFQRLRSSRGFLDVAPTDAPELYELVSAAAHRLGVRAPRLAVLDQDGRNAFAFGFTPGSSTLVVTRGLIEAMTRPEFEAIATHEIAHIKAGETRLAASLGAGAWVLGAMFRPFARILPQPALRAAANLAPRRALVAALRLFLVPGRDYRADRTASLAVSPEALRSAIVKVAEQGSVAARDPMTGAMLFIGSSSTQPNLEDRWLRNAAARIETRGAAVTAPRAAAAPGFFARFGLPQRIAAGALAMLAIVATGSSLLKRGGSTPAATREAAAPARNGEPAVAPPQFAARPTQTPAPSPMEALVEREAAPRSTGSIQQQRPAAAPRIVPLSPPQPQAARPAPQPVKPAAQAIRPTIQPAKPAAAPAPAARPQAAAPAPKPPARPQL